MILPCAPKADVCTFVEGTPKDRIHQRQQPAPLVHSACTHPSSHPFDRHILRTSSVPGTARGAGDTEMNGTQSRSQSERPVWREPTGEGGRGRHTSTTKRDDVREVCTWGPSGRSMLPGALRRAFIAEETLEPSLYI